MSSTISCGKRAAALETSSGNKLYILFEKTYESNVRPHDPDWNTVHIGYLDTAMQAIFRMAGACEGGSLRSSKGSILPENYIRAWLRELANPMVFPDFTYPLRKGSGWSDPVPSEEFPKIRKWLEEIGRGDIADTLDEGQSVGIKLGQDTDVALALYGAGRLSAWRLIRNCSVVDGTRDQSLGYSPRLVRNFAVDVPVFVRISEDEHLERRAGGGWTSCGWAYSFLGSFVSHLWESELKEPGSFFERIRAFRESARKAVKVPQDAVRVTLDTRIAPEEARSGEYYFRGIKEACAMGTDLGDGRFEIALTNENLHTLTGLPRSMARWDVDPAALLAAAGLSLRAPADDEEAETRSNTGQSD